MEGWTESFRENCGQGKVDGDASALFAECRDIFRHDETTSAFRHYGYH